MNHAVPDWMFAAFAIGGWELFDLIGRRFHLPYAHYLGGSIVLASLLVILVRYVRRWLSRDERSESQNPDDWKNY
jgi:hypothetical protein